MIYNKLVCFDLEMCCWEGVEKRTGEIIEIGIAEIDFELKTITRTAQYYVKPEKDEISKFCTELTGITSKVIKNQGRPLKEVLASINKKFGSNNKIFAAWGRDDLILFNECQTKGLEKPFYEFLNLASIFRIQNKTKNFKISQINAMKIKGLDFEGRQHSGLIDATNLAKLALTMF